MDLREYLFRKRLTIADFSKIIGYAPTYIGQIAKGNMIPGKKLVKAIEQATEGRVTAKDLSLEEINKGEFFL